MRVLVVENEPHLLGAVRQSLLTTLRRTHKTPVLIPAAHVRRRLN